MECACILLPSVPSFPGRCDGEDARDARASPVSMLVDPSLVAARTCAVGGAADGRTARAPAAAIGPTLSTRPSAAGAVQRRVTWATPLTVTRAFHTEAPPRAVAGALAPSSAVPAAAAPLPPAPAPLDVEVLRRIAALLAVLPPALTRRAADATTCLPPHCPPCPGPRDDARSTAPDARRAGFSARLGDSVAGLPRRGDHHQSDHYCSDRTMAPVRSDANRRAGNSCASATGGECARKRGRDVSGAGDDEYAPLQYIAAPAPKYARTGAWC